MVLTSIPALPENIVLCAAETHCTPVPVVCNTCPDVPSVPCASNPDCSDRLPCTVTCEAVNALAEIAPLANIVCVMPPTVNVNPVAVDQEDVDTTIIERELEIAKEQIRLEGKPENMVEKIAQGKLTKFFKENTLLNQDFVKDPSKTIKSMLKEINPELSVKTFKRVALGE